MKKRVAITDTTLRDAHQSLLATRMRLEHMLPIAAQIDAIGYHSLEVWGGATFDSCLRFLDEDPWERLRQIRRHFPNTKLQMLLRGQNLVGYKNTPMTWWMPSCTTRSRTGSTSYASSMPE